MISTLDGPRKCFRAIPAHAQSSSRIHEAVAGRRRQVRRVGRTAARRSVSAADGHQDQGIGVGVLAGMARTTLTGDNLEDFVRVADRNDVGRLGRRQHGRHGSGSPASSSTSSARTTWTSTATGNDDEFSFPAFSIPAVFHINFGPQNRSKGMFYGSSVPVFTINLSAEGRSPTARARAMDVATASTARTSVILAGAGFEIVRIGVEVRHNWGFRTSPRR